MTRPALEITTPSHGMALGAYWLGLLLGLTFLTPLNTSPAIREALIGAPAFYGWATSMAVCGALALAAAVGSTKLPAPVERALEARSVTRNARLRLAIKAEAVACGGLAFTFLIYLYALLYSGYVKLPDGSTLEAYVDSTLTTLTTKLLAATFVVGGVCRVVQVYREVRRWGRSSADPHAASPAPLADTDR